MKLSTIISENWRSTGSKLNYICGNNVCENDYYNSKPVSVLFVESALDTGLLTEAETGALATLLKAGMAKMQAAMTPNTAQDLDSLLTFMAPQGGGANKIRNLIQAAKNSKQTITSNQKWWDELFAAFNIADENIKQTVMQQVASNTGQQAPSQPIEQQPEPEQLEQPEPAAPVPQQAEPQAAPASKDWLGDLTQEKDKVLDQQSQMAELLKKSQAMRQDTHKRLDALAKRMEELRSQGATESLATDYAKAIIEFPQIRNNLPAIIELMVRSGGRRYALINEAGLNDRANQAINAVPGFLNNLGQQAKGIVANPKYAQSQFQTSVDSHTNERAAKLAIMMLTDHIRKEFVQKLQNANSTPQEIIADLGKFQGYQERLTSAGGVDPAQILAPEELTDYRTIQGKLRSVYRLFNRDKSRPFNTPAVRKQAEPIDAEAVEEEPIDAEVVGEPVTPPQLPPPEILADYLEQQRLVSPTIATVIRKSSRRNPNLKTNDVLGALMKRKLLTRDQGLAAFRMLKNQP